MVKSEFDLYWKGIVMPGSAVAQTSLVSSASPT